MTTTTAAGSPPPPAPIPRKRLPSTAPIRIRCTARLFIRWSNIVHGPDGQAGVLTHVWASRLAWERTPYRADPSWHVKDLHWVLVAYRVDW